jgi:hypothetical protein
LDTAPTNFVLCEIWFSISRNFEIPCNMNEKKILEILHIMQVFLFFYFVFIKTVFDFQNFGIYIELISLSSCDDIKNGYKFFESVIKIITSHVAIMYNTIGCWTGVPPSCYSGRLIGGLASYIGDPDVILHPGAAYSKNV